MTGPQFSWAGSFRLPVPPEVAFVAFTPRGEIGWARHWHPEFADAAVDDSAPGVVFRTREPDGTSTTWVVIDRERPHLVRYARVTPERSAGTVAVHLTSDGAGTLVDVGYRLTALGPEGEHRLRTLATDPTHSPSTWREPIAAFLARPPVPDPPVPDHP